MKRNAFTFWEILIVVAIIACGAVILWPAFRGGTSQASKDRSNCRSNFKQIGLAFAQYAQDYDERFSLVSRPEGWFGTLNPYINEKSPPSFNCPSEKLRDDNLTDYWFNRRLAGVEIKTVSDVSLTILMGDGEPSDDPNVSIQMLPPRWLEKDDSPARRHLDGANYGFADGHVKWFKPKSIVAPEKGANVPTFLVR